MYIILQSTHIYSHICKVLVRSCQKIPLTSCQKSKSAHVQCACVHIWNHLIHMTCKAFEISTLSIIFSSCLRQHSECFNLIEAPRHDQLIGSLPISYQIEALQKKVMVTHSASQPTDCFPNAFHGVHIVVTRLDGPSHLVSGLQVCHSIYIYQSIYLEIITVYSWIKPSATTYNWLIIHLQFTGWASLVHGGAAVTAPHPSWKASAFCKDSESCGHVVYPLPNSHIRIENHHL